MKDGALDEGQQHQRLVDQPAAAAEQQYPRERRVGSGGINSATQNPISHQRRPGRSVQAISHEMIVASVRESTCCTIARLTVFISADINRGWETTSAQLTSPAR